MEKDQFGPLKVPHVQYHEKIILLGAEHGLNGPDHSQGDNVAGGAVDEEEESVTQEDGGQGETYTGGNDDED